MSRGLRSEGYAALIQAGVWDYDAIVLNVMLPERDGLEVCRVLRDRRCWAPVLMLTARADVSDRIRGLDVGADDYLAKPFDFGELLARLRALTRRTPTERPARLEVGDLMVDPATHKVERLDTGTAREFAVLEFLARHAGQVVSRTMLLEHVWGRELPGLHEHRRPVRRIPAKEVGAALRQTAHPHGARRGLQAGPSAVSLPIRLRMTVWYVCLLALIISAVDAFLVVRLRADLVGAIDTNLRPAAAQIATDYRAEGVPEFPDSAGTVLKGKRAAAQLLEPGGRIVTTFGDPVARRPMVDRNDLAAVLTGATAALTRSLGPEHEAFRLTARPVRRGGRQQVIVAGQSLKSVQRSVRRVVVLLLLAGPAALLATP